MAYILSPDVFALPVIAGLKLENIFGFLECDSKYREHIDDKVFICLKGEG